MSRYVIRRTRSGTHRGTWYARRPNLKVVGRFHTWQLALHAVCLDIRERSSS